jgi:Flp pilus assembly protein TadB
MKKVLMLAVLGMFSVSAAAYACDGTDHAAKAEKSAKVVKKDTTKKDTAKDQKKS